MTDRSQVAYDLVKGYHPFDPDALGAVLAPDVTYQGVSPNGIEEFKGSESLLAAYQAWFGWYDSREVLGSEVRDVAGLPWATIRQRLRKGDDSWLMEMNYCLYEQDQGRITRLGLLCTGPQPEETR